MERGGEGGGIVKASEECGLYIVFDSAHQLHYTSRQVSLVKFSIPSLCTRLS